MNHGAVFDNTRDDHNAKNRFESFKLGKGLPSTITPKPTHVRSHSRNASVSSSISSPSFPVSSSKSTNSADMSVPPNLAPPSKRNSHHRRRSSVSTRIESAEMMGVSIPDLPPSTSDDNINLGEKDSIRRRALWALEGKPDLAFSKVEIPELSNPALEQMMYDIATKSSQPQNAVPSYGPSINSLLTSKRDSFKLLGPSSSSKDQLHTLVEEEEEEEETSQHLEAESHIESSPLTSSVTPALAFTKATPVRPRPANLNLRPLSLTPENLVSTGSGGLPTPSLTPSPRVGLKALALVPPSSTEDTTTGTTTHRVVSPAFRRPSLNLNVATESPSPAPSEDKGSRRSSIQYKSSNNGIATNFAGLPTPEMTPTSFDRRYSIGLADALRRRSGSTSSNASVDEDSFHIHPTQSRPLSASEQHFLFKSHNALLARITDLERALSTRRMSSGGTSANSSRPVSVTSDFSSSSEYGSNGEPTDEMLRLVADLKGERDELKRDVDGWRTRVGDMEKQLSLVAARVDSERREAWVARSNTGILESEKSTLEKRLTVSEQTIRTLKKENDEVKKRSAILEEELERVKQDLAEERKLSREAYATINQGILVTPTLRTPGLQTRPIGFAAKHGNGFASVDSESSVTDVEEPFDDSNPKFNFSLRAVTEDDEDVFSDEDNGLAGYEDEDESDLSFRSSSSFDSEEDLPRSVTHLQADVPVSVTPNAGTPRSTSPPIMHAPRPTHVSRVSLSKAWTFPMGSQPSKVTVPDDPDVDRFFGCLEDNDAYTSGSTSPISPSTYSYERSKVLFASGFKYDSDDENVPFFFPVGAGVEADSPKVLDVVQEEEDEDEDVAIGIDEDNDMFGVVGGIQITFTPPESEVNDSFISDCSPSPSPAQPVIPAINFFDVDEEEEVSVPFNFGRPPLSEPLDQLEQEIALPPLMVKTSTSAQSSVCKPTENVKNSVVPVPLGMITPPSSLPRPTPPRAPSPSSIPRSTSIKPLSFADSVTPPRSSLIRLVTSSNHPPNTFVTPPTKRGGNVPSFIPQPISSPSPIRSVLAVGNHKDMVAPSVSFIRQPQRKPLMLANNNMKSQTAPSGASHGSTFAPQIHTMRTSSDIHTTSTHAHSEMKSVDLCTSFSSPVNNISPSTNTITPQAYPYTVQNRTLPSSSSCPTFTTPTTEATLSRSSFSSMISSPLSARISLQTLTNFIPISWAQRNNGPAPLLFNDESLQKADRVPVSRSPAPETVDNVNRGFVSKEKQLEKLRSRLEREDPIKVRTSISVWCNKCDDEVVAL